MTLLQKTKTLSLIKWKNQLSQYCNEGVEIKYYKPEPPKPVLSDPVFPPTLPPEPVGGGGNATFDDLMIR
ncbi:MAG: hypothetical protein OXC40_04055 [Proteobacteria bacterium]|nr:hypothetical protein [Pseudomonadota bacterium]